jgi:ribosome-associated protein
MASSRSQQSHLRGTQPRSRKKKSSARAARATEPVALSEAEAQAKQLAHRIASLALDKKGAEILILDVRGKTSYADYFVIVSGESERQVSAMAEHVQTKLREEDGLRPLGIEGYERGQWVLLDFGEVVAHLFFHEARTFYDLEGLWIDVPHERVA